MTAMRLEDQVCTPEQGRQLQGLGIELQPIHWWYTGDTGTNCDHLIQTDNPDSLCHPAYSLAELGLMLPPGFHSAAATATTFRLKKVTAAAYLVEHATLGATEAQSRAALAINWIRGGHLKVEKINARIRGLLARLSPQPQTQR